MKYSVYSTGQTSTMPSLHQHAVTATATIYSKCWFHYYRIVNLKAFYTAVGQHIPNSIAFIRVMGLSTIP
jgi:hypothetical protein